MQLHADNTEAYISESVVNKDVIVQADLHGQKLPFIAQEDKPDAS